MDPSMVVVGPSLDSAILITSDSMTVSPLAPSQVVIGPSLVFVVTYSAMVTSLASRVSWILVVPLVAPSQDVVGLSLVSAITSSARVSSLALRVLGAGCGVANFEWQKAIGLVEDGWTTVNEKKVKPSTFDMPLHSQKKGSKGKA